ncbi:MAG: hypothetical protein Q8M15_02145 [Bacteroidota bacterium]|nr:hypothetical protein [Bacteroidota bacterium]
MNTEYQKYLFKVELDAIREKNSRIKRIEKIIQYMEEQGARVNSTIYDFHGVNSDYDYINQLRHDLWCSQRDIKEYEQMIEDYENEMSGLSSDSDGSDITYDLDR